MALTRQRLLNQPLSICTVQSGKITKKTKANITISSSMSTALDEMLAPRKPRIQSGAVMVVDQGFGIGRPVGGDTEAFPVFVDMSHSKDQVQATTGVVDTGYHCMKCCKHYICRLMRERELFASLCQGKKIQKVECSDSMVCREARRKKRGLRPLIKS